MLAFVNFGFWELVGIAVVGLFLFVIPVIVVLAVVIPTFSKKQQPAPYYPQPHDPLPPAS